MQLIADSGSTKTSWRLVRSLGDITNASTIGYNPQYFTTEKITASLKADLLPQLDLNGGSITEVHFYGAGCSTPSSCLVVQKAFEAVFTEAKVIIEHDLLAAARALCGRNTGVACILGTGSNSCLFDGTNVVDNVPSMGFLLGDEGSGGELGRQLVKSYFYRDMPADIQTAFEQRYGLTKDELFKNVYQSDMPSRYCAQFTKFIGEHIAHPYMHALVKKAFLAFFETQILKYKDVQNIPINFLGSIAFYFKHIIDEIARERHLKVGTIIREPIETLVDYHIG